MWTMISQPTEQNADGAHTAKRVSAPDERPKSAVSTAVGLVGLIALTLSIGWTSTLGFPSAAQGMVAMILTAAAMAAWSVVVEKVHRNPTTGLDFANPRPMAACWRDVRVKLIGLWTTWAVIGLGYWALRAFEGPGYDLYFTLLLTFLPALVGGSAAYVYFTQKYLVDPHDDLWHAGQWVLGRTEKADVAKVANHARTWLVKAFFLGFMMAIIPGVIGGVTTFGLAQALSGIVPFAVFLIRVMFLVDVVFGALGYVMTSRFLDSHVRTANPHLSGWVAALACYPPFMLVSDVLDYRQGTQEWAVWLAGHDLALIGWGAVLVVLAGFYAWATVVFGLRFSNLTHRGIITHGPYRFLKHPAYASKNVYWWLVHMPFLSLAGSGEAVRACVLLLAVNAIYFWRAKTEELHLRTDPAYQAYEAWIAEHGLGAKARRWVGRVSGWSAEPKTPRSSA